MRTMLITGASSGIGRALALRAARAGFAVCGIGRDRAALERLAAHIREEGGSVEIAVADISRAEAAQPVIEAALRAFGRLDVLVNNAGSAAAGPLAAQTDEALRAQFGTHVIGPLALVRAALPALHATGGIVVMLGSGVARVPVGGMGAYPASKAALRSATATLRRELRPLGIAVTYVDPGAVDTPFMKRGGMPGAPANVLIAPEDVARRILIALGSRPREVNAAPFSTFAVGLAERFPRLTDALLDRFPGLIGSAETGAQLPAVATAEPTPAIAPASSPAPPSDDPLAPLARRMERSGLRRAIVEGWLQRDGDLVATELATAWAGMPNKHERELTVQVLETLADAGTLQRREEGVYSIAHRAGNE